MQTETTTLAATLVECKINQDHFDFMNYYADFGMFDFTTKNAAVFALSDRLKPQHDVMIRRLGGLNRYICLIDQREYPIFGDLDVVFDCAEMGIYLDGFTFSVSLPAVYLKESL